ncbi:MAG: oxidoreductase [Alphaproteobacteria bacterium]|nr:MAG: oxidoreductase [Alphaproteobacteria bacterium]
MTVLLITGVSSGFGRAFATAALQANYTVVGTVRQDRDRDEFESLAPGRAHALMLDVTDTQAIEPLVQHVERQIGPIEVLINNAGYGHNGLVEETSLEAIRHQMEVNFFGAVAMIKAVLPAMRTRRRGRVINITSIGGLTTFAGLSIYHASKFALEGLSEALGKEVKDLGIYVTAVEPGAFRTEWAGRSMTRIESGISDYDHVRAPTAQSLRARSGKQPGDPAKAAQAMLRLIESDHPPAHLLLGRDAYQLALDKLDSLRSQFESWRALSISTDFAQ